MKVVELFVGEILSREEEWEMARGFLEGEVVMSSKKKEVRTVIIPISFAVHILTNVSFKGAVQTPQNT